MSAETSQQQTEYRVLARKYRPQNFDELIGQDALVRTLSNAIDSGRVAHAFMLTGVRGVGKTTTARIIAKALNYTGADGQAGPTTGATDDCSVCRAISEDRHPDIMEMDAASRTGVDDIREILDGVRYAPSEARYKVYVIDEVHMLSKNAFNALLKTLEEPPAHVKFIFATTEIRKVPITVLSRCQRFDLRRVDVETLGAHFTKICDLEQVSVEEDAIALISRAADGSVRDGLSLLDQAMALGGESVSAEQVQAMIGLADRARTIDVFDHIMSGQIAEALGVVDDLYMHGADPLVLLQDLMDLTHVLTRFKAVPSAAQGAQMMASDQVLRASEIASKLSMASLGKAWQILLKGTQEVSMATHPQSAAEMVLIRLAYAAELPDPAQLIKTLKSGGSDLDAASPSMSGGNDGGGSRASLSVAASGGGAPAATMPQVVVDASPDANAVVACHTLEQIVDVLEHANELVLASKVYQLVHPVILKDGHLEFCPTPEAPKTLAADLGKTLSAVSGRRWMVSVSNAPGQPTLAQLAAARVQKERDEVLALPVMKDFMSVFPDAQLADIIPVPVKEEKDETL